jgi:hypothetical protein
MRDEKLDFWIKNNFNVIFSGRHGVGKTARIKAAFARNNLRWRYFSAATMDPWCDFIGVPRAVTRPDGTVHLELVRPAEFEEDGVEAIFMDEFNRSHRKVRNAVMELIQFKSINGRIFRNLRIVWAAINPDDDEEYQVEPIDLAQKDRFHIWVDVPYKPDRGWFFEKYGDRLASAALEWWNDLPDPQKKIVSPRRLDYALEVFRVKGDVKDVLPHSSNISKLITAINTGPVNERLKEFFDGRDAEKAKEFLAVENNFAGASRFLVSAHEFQVDSNEWMIFFLPLIPTEKLSTMVSNSVVVCEHVLGNYEAVPRYRRILEDILAANTNKNLVRRIKKVMSEPKTLAYQFGRLRSVSPAKPHFNQDSIVDWGAELTSFRTQPMEKTPQRFKIYTELSQKIPAKLSTSDAVATLAFLSTMMGRCHKDTLHDPIMRSLMGVVNHCINQISVDSSLGWIDILNIYGEQFDKLLIRIQESKLEDFLLIPVVQPQSISGLVNGQHNE